MTTTHVPYGDNMSDTATLLLAAADDLDLPVEVVQTTEGGFRVPEEVANKAGFGEQPKAVEDKDEPKESSKGRRNTKRSDS